MDASLLKLTTFTSMTPSWRNVSKVASMPADAIYADAPKLTLKELYARFISAVILTSSAGNTPVNFRS